MIRLETFGLALAWTLLMACGSARVAPPLDSEHVEMQTTDQTLATHAAELAYRNTLRWSTASEVDNFGFDVYRAESEEGPFVRLNDSPIPGAGTSDVPTYYEYVDDTIAPGLEYFYYIESISIDGEREKFTPTYRAAPKIPPTSSEDRD